MVSKPTGHILSARVKSFLSKTRAIWTAVLALLIFPPLGYAFLTAAPYLLKGLKAVGAFLSLPVVSIYNFYISVGQKQDYAMNDTIATVAIILSAVACFYIIRATLKASKHAKTED